MAAETIVIDIVANFKNQTSAGMNSAKQSADRFTDSMQKAKREADKLGGTNARPKVTLVDRASSALSKIDNGLRAVGGKTFRAGVKILDYATTPLRKIKNALFSIKGLVAAVGAGLVANKLFSQPISLADQYSSAKIGFSTLLGESEGQKMMNEIDAFAKKTPFNTSGVIGNVQKMIAMGWNPENILKDLEVIGNAAASTGRGDEGLASITYALSEIRSKGKLSTQELNQLASAGIKAKAYLAEGLGYGTSDEGMKKLAQDLEKGAIGANQAIELIMQGMKEFDGMMDRTANETVDGLKAQLEDVFEINIARKWGQGLQDGVRRGLGSIVTLLDESEEGIAKLGDTVYEVGKELSNWAADKLEGTIDKIMELMDRDDFKNASFGEKIKIMWNEVIAEPFGKWWDETGKPFIAKKMESLGESLGSGLTKGLLALLGIDVIGITGEAASIGGSFASGFAKGFEGVKVWDGIVKAAGRAFKSGFKSLFTGSALERIIVGGIAFKTTSGILKGLSAVQTLWSGTGAVAGTGGYTLAGMGLKGILGSTGNAMVSGSGILGSLASLGYKSTGFTPTAGMYFGNMSGAMSGGTAALAGLGTAAGIAGGIAGTVNAIGDLTNAVESQTRNDEKLYGTRAGVKASMVGIGAGIGTLIAPGIGTAIGAGLGGIATFLAGNKLADSISGVSKSTKELHEEAKKLAEENMAKRFGEATLTAEKLESRIQKVFGAANLTRVSKFKQSLSDLSTITDTVLGSKGDVEYAAARIHAGEKLSDSDITAYKTNLEEYVAGVKDLVSLSKTNSISALELLYGDDKKGLQKATKQINESYTKLEKELSTKTKKLNKVISDAFNDGKITIDEQKKIDEILASIDEIYSKIEERQRKVEQKKSELKMQEIGEDYSDKSLTKDDFKTLVNSLDEQGKTNKEAIDEAYLQSKAEYGVMKDEGELTPEQYKKNIETATKKWAEESKKNIMSQLNVIKDVLNENYGTEMNLFSSNYAQKGFSVSDKDLGNIRKATSYQYQTSAGPGSRRLVTKTGYKWDEKSAAKINEIKENWLDSMGVDLATQKEFQWVYETLKPKEEELNKLKSEFEKLGIEVPKWIQDELDYIENIKLMSGDEDSFYKMYGEKLATEDKAYATKLLNEAGEELPKAFREGIEKGLGVVEVSTNLELTTDKSKIDTSSFDKTTADVIQKLQDKDIIKITKDGEVTIKTKDGKIDTTGLDEATKKAVQELEEKGILVVKDGKVTINADVNTDGAAEKTKTETEGALGGTQNVNRTANVKVDSTTTGEGEAAEKSKGETTAAIDGKYALAHPEMANVHVTGVKTTGIAAAAASAWNSFKTTIKTQFSNDVWVNPRLKYSIGHASGNTGDEDGDGKKANGGYVDRAIKTIVGEAGPEMIIPLSAERRQRGKYLWEKAGRAMGLWGNQEPIYQNANGGLYGSGASKLWDFGNNSDEETETVQTKGRSGQVNVNVGGVTIKVDSQDTADDIAGQIAEILEKAFQNIPVTVG